MRPILSMVLLGVALLLAGSARAAESALDLLDAPVGYTAAFTVSSDKGTFHGRVWHLPGRERREWETSGGGQAVIVRRDTDAAYLLKPSGKWYVGLGLRAVAALAGGLDGMQVERRRLRDETVAGQRATRWKTTASGPKGRFDGDVWTTPKGIVVKAAGTVTQPGGAPAPVEMTLSDVEVEAIDTTLFDPPKGWFGMDLRQVPPDKIEQAVESLKPLLEGRAGGGTARHP
ncbi:MAG: hypothetical protein ACM31L_11865 [Actinomycetota bacterium]